MSCHKLSVMCTELTPAVSKKRMTDTSVFLWDIGNRAAAWRVHVAIDDKHPCIPLVFASERDATGAMRAMVEAGMVDAESIIAAGIDELRRVMISGLRW